MTSKKSDAIQPLPSVKSRFHFIKNRNPFFAVSAIIMIIGIVFLLVAGMHFGVDFKAGTSLDLNVGQTIEKQKVQEIVTGTGFKDVVTTIGGNNNDRVSLRFGEILSDPDLKKVQDAFTAAIGKQVSTEVNIVSPDMARELGVKAIYAILIASVAICLYVTIRFEWRFAVAAIIAILHDAFMVIAFFAIFRFEVNLPFLAAILTTIGYSINDKIVIFDRIRENSRFTKLKTADDLSTMINDSLWQTMARNLNTVLTVLVAALCLFIFGSPAIKLFALAKLIGLTSGAYSSICIASPLWYLFKGNSLKSGLKVTSSKP